MATTKAQQKANRKWNESNLERLYVTVKKGEKAEIKKAADEMNESLNSYIVSAIHEKMQKKKG